MIRFAVFDDAGPAREWPLRHAHLICKEGYAVPATVCFEEGMIVCPRKTTDAVAIALQVDAGAPGLLTLQTCLLPPRDEPYLLNLELARHRIMMILNKLEAWGLTDLPTTDPVMQGFDEARDLFTQSLISGSREGGGFDVEQARLAHRALELAIEASEKLALEAAERDLNRRFTVVGTASPESDDDDTLDGVDLMEQPPLPAALGCTVHVDQFSEPLQAIVARHFEFIHCPMRWRDIEREEGKYRFNLSDRWIEWAIRVGKKRVAAGPILDFSARSIPKWLYIWQHDYDSFREFAYEHVKRVVTRYRKTVSRWTIVSGVNINQHFGFSLEQMLDLTRLAALLTKKLHPGAEVVVEIDQPFGEHGTHQRGAVPAMFYAEMVRETGINIDGIALRLQMGQGEMGRSTRDMAQLSDIIDQYAGLGLPLHITAIGAPHSPVPGRRREDEGDESFVDGGFWHRPWNQAVQARWMTEAMSIALSKFPVASVCWQALFDTTANPEMPHGGLITADGRAKASLRRLADVSGAYFSQRSPTTLPPVEDTGAPAATPVTE